MKTFGIVVAMGALLASVAPAAAAPSKEPTRMNATVTVMGHATDVKGSPADHLLTFSGPVEIPGVALHAGTYVFKPIEGTSLVRVTNTDGSIVYATFFTTPVARTDDTKQPLVTFERVGARSPVRMAAWFTQGNSIGMSPLYPPAMREAAAD